MTKRFRRFPSHRFQRAPALALLALAALAAAPAGAQSLARVRTGSVEPARLEAGASDGFALVNEVEVPVRVVFAPRSAKALECEGLAARRVRTAVYVIDAAGVLQCRSPLREVKYSVYTPDGQGGIEEVAGRVRLAR